MRTDLLSPSDKKLTRQGQNKASWKRPRTRTVMAFSRLCKETGQGQTLTFPSRKKRGLFCRSSDGALRIKNIRRNSISDIPPTTYPAFCMIKRRRGATAEKIGTENGLAPCALLLTFGRTVGLSLSIRSIPPVMQEMNPSADMIKAEGLRRAVKREREEKGASVPKGKKAKDGPPTNGKGVPRGRSHLGLLGFAEQRHSRLFRISTKPCYRVVDGLQNRYNMFDKFD